MNRPQRIAKEQEFWRDGMRVRTDDLIEHNLALQLEQGLIRVTDKRPGGSAKKATQEIRDALLFSGAPMLHLIDILENASNLIGFYVDAWDWDSTGGVEPQNQIRFKTPSDELCDDGGARADAAGGMLDRLIKMLEAKNLTDADSYRVALQGLVVACYDTEMQNHPAFQSAEMLLLDET